MSSAPERQTVFKESDNQYELPFAIGRSWGVFYGNEFNLQFNRHPQDFAHYETLLFHNPRPPTKDDLIHMTSFSYSVRVNDAEVTFNYDWTFGYDSLRNEVDGFQLAQHGISTQIKEGEVTVKTAGSVVLVTINGGLTVCLPRELSPDGARILFTEPETVFQPERVEQITREHPLEVADPVW